MNVVGISGDVIDETQQAATGNGSMDKDDFLLLLVTQLQYQDPLEPVSNSEMAAQLAQYSQLETLNNMHATMQDQLLLDQSLNNSFMTSLIGKDVKAYGNAATYDGNDVELSYYLGGNGDVTVKIYDEDGQLVQTIDQGNERYGDRSVVWDGIDQYGNTVPEGNYTFEVEATDNTGNPIQTETYTQGMVEGITYLQGSPFLLIHGQPVNLGNVISILYHDGSDDSFTTDLPSTES
ncbi:MAG: flagellar hook capping protein [Candidatus Cloacimonetes bacterium]|nr:flagellar hook capping protein [Candidatus Cloacimonadota bacterium]